MDTVLFSVDLFRYEEIEFNAEVCLFRYEV